MVTTHKIVSAKAPSPIRPYRRTFVVVELLLAVCGAAGAVQLGAGLSTPPPSDLRVLGLTSWVLPGIWLLLTVAVPAAVAATLALRRSYLTPTAVTASGLLLALELLVQIPFIGLSVLQLIFGTVAFGLIVLGIRADGRWRA
jgi:hypothetical protein